MKKVNLTINGRARQVVAKPDLVLLDLLRKGYGLTGTKTVLRPQRTVRRLYGDCQ